MGSFMLSVFLRQDSDLAFGRVVVCGTWEWWFGTVMGQHENI